MPISLFFVVISNLASFSVFAFYPTHTLVEAIRITALSPAPSDYDHTHAHTRNWCVLLAVSADSP